MLSPHHLNFPPRLQTGLESFSPSSRPQALSAAIADTMTVGDWMPTSVLAPVSVHPHPTNKGSELSPRSLLTKFLRILRDLVKCVL